MRKLMLLLVWILPLFSSCSQEDEEPAVDAFIFGSWNFFCEGNCIQIYKYDQGKLYIDNMNSFREAPVITYKASALDAQWNAKAEALRDEFPESYLRPLGNTLIACPNCIEEGGYYIAFENQTGVLWWQVGKEPALWPDEIKPFMDLLVKTIGELPAQ
ncbi:MAG: hypothetical protein LPK25_17640 [Cyclobacteriaceae bacterium]|nr:hypothetical protein [Cyclobacteriaceae bacterium]MDX5468177.1 hypothetical protein [Cyclobacteriaceae bacterium]